MGEAFEIGPIRPPSEAESLLIRVTRNCPWNKCKFCRIYKRQSFQTRPMEEIERDIDNIARIRDTLLGAGITGPAPDYGRIGTLVREKSAEERECYEHVYRWMVCGGQNAFLQDANTMVLSYDKLMRILTYLRHKLPEIKRLTTYGRVDALNRLSGEQYASLRDAGLNRIHSGFETGSDKALALINKGYTKSAELEAGRKVKDAGIELSVYVMPGVGGRELSEDNALETADVISRVNPDFVRVRTFVCMPGTGLMDDLEAGRFTEGTDMEKLLELETMLRNVENADGTIYSDHIINLIEGVSGSLADDMEKMLALIDGVKRLPARVRKRFQLARRMGLIRDISELDRIGGHHGDMIERAIDECEDDAQWEELLLSLLRRYI